MAIWLLCDRLVGVMAVWWLHHMLEVVGALLLLRMQVEEIQMVLMLRPVHWHRQQMGSVRRGSGRAWRWVVAVLGAVAAVACWVGCWQVAAAGRQCCHRMHPTHRPVCWRGSGQADV